jgi:signal transduction histidine kinase
VPGLDIEFNADAGLTLDDSAVAQTLLRCIQELITNAIKHSGANRLEITLQKLDNLLILKTSDDGKGATLSRLGNGLQGMKERIADLQGQMLIQTSPGQGFTVSITLPLGGRS